MTDNNLIDLFNEDEDDCYIMLRNGSLVRVRVIDNDTVEYEGVPLRTSDLAEMLRGK